MQIKHTHSHFTKETPKQRKVWRWPITAQPVQGPQPDDPIRAGRASVAQSEHPKHLCPEHSSHGTSALWPWATDCISPLCTLFWWISNCICVPPSFCQTPLHPPPRAGSRGGRFYPGFGFSAASNFHSAIVPRSCGSWEGSGLQTGRSVTSIHKSRVF